MIISLKKLLTLLLITIARTAIFFLRVASPRLPFATRRAACVLCFLFVKALQLTSDNASLRVCIRHRAKWATRTVVVLSKQHNAASATDLATAAG